MKEWNDNVKFGDQKVKDFMDKLVGFIAANMDDKTHHAITAQYQMRLARSAYDKLMSEPWQHTAEQLEWPAKLRAKAEENSYVAGGRDSLFASDASTELCKAMIEFIQKLREHRHVVEPKEGHEYR